MEPLAGWYLFWLGVAAGSTAVAITAYLRVSPGWLKTLLVVAGVFTLSRYVTMVLFATSADPQEWWWLRWCWFGTSIGLTFPTVVAMDQLVRHPAMTPKKLLRWFAPWLTGYAIVLGFGRFELISDPILGMSPELTGWAVVLLSLLQSTFVLGVLWLGWQVLRKLPGQPLQLALAGLLAAQLYLGVDGILERLGWWYFRPFLFSEILALWAIWFALTTARSSTV